MEGELPKEGQGKIVPIDDNRAEKLKEQDQARLNEKRERIRKIAEGILRGPNRRKTRTPDEVAELVGKVVSSKINGTYDKLPPRMKQVLDIVFAEGVDLKEVDYTKASETLGMPKDLVQEYVRGGITKITAWNNFEGRGVRKRHIEIHGESGRDE